MARPDGGGRTRRDREAPGLDDKTMAVSRASWPFVRGCDEAETSLPAWHQELPGPQVLAPGWPPSPRRPPWPYLPTSMDWLIWQTWLLWPCDRGHHAWQAPSLFPPLLPAPQLAQRACQPGGRQPGSPMPRRLRSPPHRSAKSQADGPACVSRGGTEPSMFARRPRPRSRTVRRPAAPRSASVRPTRLQAVLQEQWQMPETWPSQAGHDLSASGKPRRRRRPSASPQRTPRHWPGAGSG